MHRTGRDGTSDDDAGCGDSGFGCTSQTLFTSRVGGGERRALGRRRLEAGGARRDGVFGTGRGICGMGMSLCKGEEYL